MCKIFRMRYCIIITFSRKLKPFIFEIFNTISL